MVNSLVCLLAVMPVGFSFIIQLFPLSFWERLGVRVAMKSWCRNISQEIRSSPACARLIVWGHKIPPCISIRSTRAILHDEYFRVKAEKYRVAVQPRLRADAKSLTVRACDLHIIAKCDPSGRGSGGERVNSGCGRRARSGGRGGDDGHIRGRKPNLRVLRRACAAEGNCSDQ